MLIADYVNHEVTQTLELLRMAICNSNEYDREVLLRAAYGNLCTANKNFKKQAEDRQGGEVE